MSKLAEICLDKLEHVKRQKNLASISELESSAKSQEQPRGFHARLKSKIENAQNALTCEVKKASPSKGLIRADFNPAEIAKAYEKAGATCISVLTDEPYFQGKDEYLREVKNAVNLPILRKDFMLDPYQIYESRALGADCILLIIAALETRQAQELENTAIALGMDVLIEVHNEEELEQALQLKSKLIGINNRDLKTLQVNLDTTVRLAKLIPPQYTVVCESGIATHDDIKLMNGIGIRSFLVGESLMKQDDIYLATTQLLSGE